MNNEPKPVAPIPPFKAFCGQIGAFPTAFTDSMTVYECLAWLYKYLDGCITPTLNANVTAVAELKEYVEHYFDSLDVQEEINNKLDAMAESGELEEIIAAYINTSAILAYDTVASMVSAENLVDGCFVETYGFYAKGDKGGAKYKIREIVNTDTVDNITLIALDDENLVAELIPQARMNVRQFGAKGDESTDDTAKIQAALDFCPTIEITSGTYMIDAVTSLLPNSNNQIYLDETATLKAIPNNQTHYAVIKLDDVDNVIIKGGTVEGERDDHLGETGEWGHCVSIVNGSSNITLENIILKNGWGDGVYINDCVDVRTTNLVIDNVRRNGISVISATNYKSTNDTIRNTNGTAPQAGVDVEPNYDYNVLKDICFENLHTENNVGRGLSIMLGHSLTNPVSIKLVNHHDNGSISGLSVAKLPAVKGLIEVISPVYYNSIENGIFLRSCYDGDCLLKIIRPYIYNCNTQLSSSVAYGTGISIYSDADDTDAPLGNIEIYEPYITNAREASTSCIYLKPTGSGTSNDKISNIKIINPLYTQTKFINFGTTNIENFIFKDEYNAIVFPLTGSGNLLANQVYGSIEFTGTQARTLTVNANNPVEKVVKITNLSAYTLTITLTDQTCSMLGVTSGGSIKLTHYGDSITLKKMTNTEWIITEINCTPTIA